MGIYTRPVTKYGTARQPTINPQEPHYIDHYSQYEVDTILILDDGIQ